MEDLILPDWLTPDWTDPDLAQDDDESLTWMRQRPPHVQAVMKQFPPNCAVMATQPLVVPGPGQVGVVVGYTDDRSTGTLLLVREHPRHGTVAQCQLAWVRPVAYFRNLTPERMEEILNDRPGNEGANPQDPPGAGGTS